MYKLDDHIGAAVAGITADANILINTARCVSMDRHPHRASAGREKHQRQWSGRFAAADWVPIHTPHATIGATAVGLTGSCFFLSVSGGLLCRLAAQQYTYGYQEPMPVEQVHTRQSPAAFPAFTRVRATWHWTSWSLGASLSSLPRPSDCTC
jgi:hypothetical protein